MATELLESIGWIQSTKMYRMDVPPIVIFSGSAGKRGDVLYYPPDKWNLVDLKPFGVTSDATTCDINGHMIIGHGRNPVTAILTACFRPPNGAQHKDNYQMIQIEPWRGEGFSSGERHQSLAGVNLVDGCFEFYWQMLYNDGSPGYKKDKPPSEGGSDYLLNLRLESWWRK